MKLYAQGACEWCGEQTREGSVFEFAVSAETDDGRRYCAKKSTFVAKHDPSVERRRLPLHWGRFSGNGFEAHDRQRKLGVAV